MPVFLVAVGFPVAQALLSASRAKFTSAPKTQVQRLKLYAITAFMHLQQPMARLIGRLKHGLTPWRRRGANRWQLPVRRSVSVWHEQWQAAEQTLARLQALLSQSGAVAVAGGDYERWDLEIRGGLFGGAHLLMAAEEHGAGKQMLRFRIAPKWSALTFVPIIFFTLISLGAAEDGAYLVSLLSAACAMGVAGCALADSGFAVGSASEALEQLGR